jgi:hypothetical protein
MNKTSRDCFNTGKEQITTARTTLREALWRSLVVGESASPRHKAPHHREMLPQLYRKPFTTPSSLHHVTTTKAVILTALKGASRKVEPQ